MAHVADHLSFATLADLECAVVERCRVLRACLSAPVGAIPISSHIDPQDWRETNVDRRTSGAA